MSTTDPVLDKQLERDSLELHALLKRCSRLADSLGAWGMRIEVVSDGRVRADFFDGSGYSMIDGESTGDVHEEVNKPLWLPEMRARVLAKQARKAASEVTKATTVLK